MTMALILAIINAIAALVAHVTNRGIVCGFHIALTVVFILVALCCEGKTLNRITKLEEKIAKIEGV